MVSIIFFINIIKKLIFYYSILIHNKTTMAAARATFEIENTYKPFGGILKCPRIEPTEFQCYREMINSKIDSDGSLKRVDVALLDDKPYHHDYDVYLEQDGDLVNKVNRIFGFNQNNNINGDCYSLQIGRFQTDFIILQNPKMGQAFYSVSCGVLLHILLSNSAVKMRSTDLCCKVGSDTFIISTDPIKSYEYLGLDLDALLKMRSRSELFTMIQKSRIYDPELILELSQKKGKDMIRPIMCDFVEFCKANPRISQLPKSIDLNDALEHFEKASEYRELLSKKGEDEKRAKLVSNAKTIIANELKTKGGYVGKDIATKLAQFKEWIISTFKMEYEIWLATVDVNILETLHMFLKSV